MESSFSSSSISVRSPCLIEVSDTLQVKAMASRSILDATGAMIGRSFPESNSFSRDISTTSSLSFCDYSTGVMISERFMLETE